MGAHTVAAVQHFLEDIHSPSAAAFGEGFFGFNGEDGVVLLGQIHAVTELIHVEIEEILIGVVLEAAFHVRHGGEVKRVGLSGLDSGFRGAFWGLNGCRAAAAGEEEAEGYNRR